MIRGAAGPSQVRGLSSMIYSFFGSGEVGNGFSELIVNPVY